jgi:heme/copper-type cytochrome/quinol oxidase subunit 2
MNEGQNTGAKSILFVWMVTISVVVVMTSTIFTSSLIKYRTDDIIRQTMPAVYGRRDGAGNHWPNYHDG